MGGLLTCHQCSKPMENLKDHSFLDFYRTWMRIYFCFLHLLIVIMLTLLIVHDSIGRECPEDQAKLLDNISQLEVEKVTLKKQLIKMEKEMQKLRNVTNPSEEKILQLLEKKQEETDALRKESSAFQQSFVLTRQLLEKEKEKSQSLQSQLEIAKEDLRQLNVMNRTQEKTLQLLEKKQEEADALSKESSGFKQSLVLTRELLEKEKEKSQSLQSQLEIAKEDLQKVQQQRDSCQKQLNTLEEKHKSADKSCKAEEYKGKIAELQQQVEQGKRFQDTLTKNERMPYENRIRELENQIELQQQKKCSIENIVDDGTIVTWVIGIVVFFSFGCICCVKCLQQIL